MRVLASLMGSFMEDVMVDGALGGGTQREEVVHWDMLSLYCISSLLFSCPP